MGGPIARLTGERGPVDPEAGDRGQSPPKQATGCRLTVRWPGTQRPTRGKNVRLARSGRRGVRKCVRSINFCTAQKCGPGRAHGSSFGFVWQR